MSNEPEREMTFEEWLDRLPKFHRVHRDFENLIAQAREEGRREAEDEIARLKEDRELWVRSEYECLQANLELEAKLKIAIEGLEEAQIALSRFIDSAIPYYDHPLNKNNFLHENNPARVALEKIRNYPGIPEGSKGLSSLKAPSKGTK